MPGFPWSKPGYVKGSLPSEKGFGLLGAVDEIPEDVPGGWGGAAQDGFVMPQYGLDGGYYGVGNWPAAGAAGGAFGGMLCRAPSPAAMDIDGTTAPGSASSVDLYQDGFGQMLFPAEDEVAPVFDRRELVPSLRDSVFGFMAEESGKEQPDELFEVDVVAALELDPGESEGEDKGEMLVEDGVEAREPNLDKGVGEDEDEDEDENEGDDEDEDEDEEVGNFLLSDLWE